MSSSNRAIALTHMRDLNRPSGGRFLIHNVLPRKGLAVVWGEPKSGKSFWVLDVAFHVASGRKWRGLATAQGPVVYAAFEGQDGIPDRVQALRRLNGGGDFPMWVCMRRLIFNKHQRPDKRNHMLFIQSIDETLKDVKPRLVILDTLHRSLEGNENDAGDMAFYTSAAMEIGEKFGCLVLIVHHPGKEGNGPRGHSSITGTCDCQIKIGKKGDMVFSQVEYVKDGPVGPIMRARLIPVEMEPDEEGLSVTTCLLEPVEGASDFPVSLAKRKESGLVKPHLRHMIEAMQPLIDTDGWADYDAWMNICLRQGDFRSKDLDQRKRTFKGRLGELKELALVEQDQNRIRITEKGMKFEAA
jgi:AAA domain